MVKVLQTTGALTAAGELFQRHLTHPPFIALLLHTPLLSITSQQTNAFLVGTSSELPQANTCWLGPSSVSIRRCFYSCRSAPRKTELIIAKQLISVIIPPKPQTPTRCRELPTTHYLLHLTCAFATPHHNKTPVSLTHLNQLTFVTDFEHTLAQAIPACARIHLKTPCHLARITAAKSSQMNSFSDHTVLSTAGSYSVSNPPTFLFSHLILHASYVNGKDSEYATWGFGRSGAQHCFLLTRTGAKINWQRWAGTNTIS